MNKQKPCFGCESEKQRVKTGFAHTCGKSFEPEEVKEEKIVTCGEILEMFFNGTSGDTIIQTTP